MKKALKPSARKELAEQVVTEKGLSVFRACKLVSLSRSMWYYQTKRDDTEVIDKQVEMSKIKPNRGFDYHYHRIREQGFVRRIRCFKSVLSGGAKAKAKQQKKAASEDKSPAKSTYGTEASMDC